MHHAPYNVKLAQYFQSESKKWVIKNVRGHLFILV